MSGYWAARQNRGSKPRGGPGVAPVGPGDPPLSRAGRHPRAAKGLLGEAKALRRLTLSLRVRRKDRPSSGPSPRALLPGGAPTNPWTKTARRKPRQPPHRAGSAELVKRSPAWDQWRSPGGRRSPPPRYRALLLGGNGQGRPRHKARPRKPHPKALHHHGGGHTHRDSVRAMVAKARNIRGMATRRSVKAQGTSAAPPRPGPARRPQRASCQGLRPGPCP